MFFGMCNSPATFQSMMDAIFADMIDDNIVIIYMDNISSTLLMKKHWPRTPGEFWRDYEIMICSWNQQNASSTSQKLNIEVWSLKKGKFRWTLENSREYETGQLQQWSNKYEHSVDLATSIDDSSGTSLNLLWLQMIKAIINSHRFEGSSSDEPRRVQVLDLYCLTRFESENSRRGDVY